MKYARQNIERSTIVADYINAKEGYFCQFYGKNLERSPNIFGLPEIYDKSLFEPVSPASASDQVDLTEGVLPYRKGNNFPLRLAQLVQSSPTGPRVILSFLRSLG